MPDKYQGETQKGTIFLESAAIRKIGNREILIVQKLEGRNEIPSSTLSFSERGSIGVADNIKRTLGEWVNIGLTKDYSMFYLMASTEKDETAFKIGSNHMTMPNFLQKRFVIERKRIEGEFEGENAFFIPFPFKRRE